MILYQIKKNKITVATPSSVKKFITPAEVFYSLISLNLNIFDEMNFIVTIRAY